MNSRTFTSARANNISLVHHTEVSQAIEAGRLLQQVLPAVEGVLAELNSLISTLQGLAHVRPELNPLRPDVFAQVLREMIFSTPVAPAIASLWIKYLAPALGRELTQIYGQLVQQLENANVKGARYRLLLLPSSPPAAQTNRAKNAAQGGRVDTTSQSQQGGSVAHPADRLAADEPLQYADLSSHDISGKLFQDFLFHGGSDAERELTPSYYKAVDDAFADISQDADLLPEWHSKPPSAYDELAAVDRPPRRVDARSGLDPKLWGAYSRPGARARVRNELKRKATRVGQVLGLEVVRKLVNQMAQDARLLAPVRQAIIALEPSLLWLAFAEPRFFSVKSHAGRRLLERVAQRSFRYNDEFGAEFCTFFTPVGEAFNELNSLTIVDARPFEQALATLEAAWQAQDHLEQENRNRVLRALRFAEDRQAQADHIAFGLSTRTDLERVPGIVLDFLFGPWALALAHASLIDTRAHVDARGFDSVVPDLLWSIRQDVTLKQPAKLIAMIPGLLGKLHAGLELLGQDPRESDAFFEGLMALHRPVLKLRRLKSRQEAQASGAIPLEPEHAITLTQPLPGAAQPWLARDERDAAGFEDAPPSTRGELLLLNETAGDTAEFVPDSNDQALPSDARVSPPLESPLISRTHEEAEHLLACLRPGQWVDLYSRGRWLRAQLVWASTKATLFMFVSHGGQPHSMTRRSCERLIRQRLLRPVETHGVVAGALDQLGGLAGPTLI